MSRASGSAPASPAPHRVIWLSVAAAVVTIVLKMVAWVVTDSVGLLSDALESFVNLAGALFAVRMLTIARTPADAGHPFGHTKAEYMSSGFEGVLILGAALAITWAAVGRLLSPQPLESLDVGLVISIVASAINFTVARVLLKASHTHHSPALAADARHLLTDVWTTGGLVAGLLLVIATEAVWIDPVLAILVAANIAREAWRILRDAFEGLLDAALDPATLVRIHEVLQRYAARGVVVGPMHSRRAGPTAFLTVVLRVPGAWSVRTAHDLADEIEAALAAAVPGLDITTHIEPTETPT